MCCLVMDDSSGPPSEPTRTAYDGGTNRPVAGEETSPAWEAALLLMQARTTAAASLGTCVTLESLLDAEPAERDEKRSDGGPAGDDGGPSAGSETAYAVDDLIEKQRRVIENLEAVRERYSSAGSHTAD